MNLAINGKFSFLSNLVAFGELKGIYGTIVMYKVISNKANGAPPIIGLDHD